MSNEQYPKLPSPYPVSELSPTIETATPGPQSRFSQRRWVRYGADALLGLGLLSAGLPLAWLSGLGAARLIASPSERMPLQEIILRRTNRVVTEIYRLPSRWQPTPPPETRIEPIPIPTQPIAPLVPPTAALNEREQQIAAEELTALEQEFETIRKRLFDLESKLGQAQSTADVESRLANLARRLDAGQLTGQLNQPTAEPAALPNDLALTNQPLQAKPHHLLLETTELKITLPSDALFVPGEARLLVSAPTLLNSIFEDLAQYPNATILIGSHLDDQMEPSQSLNLTFQQANALRAYLAGHLTDNRWVTIGYGHSQPVTDNSTPQFRQRNRRIEIAIDRR